MANWWQVLAGEPYFVYDTVYTDGLAWNTITDGGVAAAKYAALSSKAAVGMWALWVDPYSDLLLEKVKTLVDPVKGIREGNYEDGRGPIQTFTANTNGIILETLLYRKIGKLLPRTHRQGLWEASLTRTGPNTFCRPRAPETGKRSERQESK